MKYTLTKAAKIQSEDHYQSSICSTHSSNLPPRSNIPPKHPAQVVHIPRFHDLFDTPYLQTELTQTTLLDVADLLDVL